MTSHYSSASAWWLFYVWQAIIIESVAFCATFAISLVFKWAYFWLILTTSSLTLTLRGRILKIQRKLLKILINWSFLYDILKFRSIGRIPLNLLQLSRQRSISFTYHIQP